MLVTFGEVVSFEGYLKVRGVVTFRWRYFWGGRFFRVIFTLGCLVLLDAVTFGNRFFRVVVTIGWVVAFGWSLLSGGRYFRVSVIFGVVVSFGW